MWVHMTPASLQLDLQRQLLYLQSLSLLSHGAAEYAAAANVARWPARHLKSSWPMLDIPVSAVDEYEAVMSKYKAAERQMEKLDSQIRAIKEDVARKTLTAAKSPFVMGAKEEELIELSQELNELVEGYGDMHGDLGCPCCRGVPNAKKAAMEMLEAGDILRESFTEGPNLLPMPHSTISQRREAYEAKAGEACELRRQSLERLLSSIEEAREFLGSFQSLQGQFNCALESVTMRNALMLLGEESSSSAAQPGKREGKRLMAAAAKNGSKSRKAAAHKKAAEQKPDRTATDHTSMAAATSDPDTEDSSDKDAAVESAVSHNNPFAALNGEEDGTAEPVAELVISDSSSEHSASTSAGFEQHLDGGASSASHSHSKPHRHRHEHAEPDLAAQRQAILAKFRGSNAGALQLAVGDSNAASVAPQSNGHAPHGQLGSRQADFGELGTAQQLRAKLGNGLLALELVEHLCCPITEEVIQDPVVAMDGLTYERSAILDWFAERPAGFSYLTKQRLSSKVLLPNNDYRSLVVQLTS